MPDRAGRASAGSWLSSEETADDCSAASRRSRRRRGVVRRLGVALDRAWRGGVVVRGRCAHRLLLAGVRACHNLLRGVLDLAHAATTGGGPRLRFGGALVLDRDLDRRPVVATDGAAPLADSRPCARAGRA